MSLPLFLARRPDPLAQLASAKAEVRSSGYRRNRETEYGVAHALPLHSIVRCPGRTLPIDAGVADRWGRLVARNQNVVSSVAGPKCQSEITAN